MNLSELTFKIQEIPEGKSQKSRKLPADSINLGDDVYLNGVEIEIEFHKTNHFILIRFEAKADLKLICDRCLEPFNEMFECNYEVLFKPELAEDEQNIDEHSAVKEIPHDELIINLEKEVRDTIMLEVPIKKIHPKFMDSNGFIKDFEMATFGSTIKNDDDEIDPRWEKLKKLKQK